MRKAGFSKEPLNNTQEITLRTAEKSFMAKGSTRIIADNTKKELSFDMTYVLERMEKDQWYEINGSQAFKALAEILPDNGSAEFWCFLRKNWKTGLIEL